MKNAHRSTPLTQRLHLPLRAASFSVVACVAVLFLVAPSFAQEAAAPAAVDDDADVVELSTKSGEKTTTRGEVVDWTGSQLRLKTREGRETSYPADRVLRVSTSHIDEEIAGDVSFAAREYRSALAAYDKAAQRETRTWVKRQITAQRVWCLRMLGQTPAAVKLFLALEQSDPQTIHFDCAPLLWSVSECPEELKAAAKGWLGDSQSKAAQLIGASWLLISDRAAARAKLEELAKLRHPALPWLAQAQLWRGEVVSAKPDDLTSWGRLVERMPTSLQSGPSYVVGLGWSQQRDDDEAALWFLRVPLLDARDRKLAVESLQRSGEAFEKLQRPQSAAQMYREIVSDYAEFPSAVLAAQSRLGELSHAPRR